MLFDRLCVDAVRFDVLAQLSPKLLLPYALSNVFACPGWCQQPFALMVDQPVAMEIELGTLGKAHLRCLADYMRTKCTETNPLTHVRTDGSNVWEPV